MGSDQRRIDVAIGDIRLIVGTQMHPSFFRKNLVVGK